MLFVLFLLQIIQTVASEDLCMKDCKQGLPGDTCSSSHCVEKIGNNCCRTKAGTIEVDLRNCHIDEIGANFFLEDQILANETESIATICLDNNGFGLRNVSADALRGLTGLRIITLPHDIEHCPGGDIYWENAKSTPSALVCEGQKAPCNTSGEVCPEKSHCVDDGPGLMRCLCDDGYYGYKCLKSGEFPYATFFGSLGAATVVTSAVLWFIGRRKIGAHTKQM